MSGFYQTRTAPRQNHREHAIRRSIPPYGMADAREKGWRETVLPMVLGAIVIAAVAMLILHVWTSGGAAGPVERHEAAEVR